MPSPASGSGQAVESAPAPTEWPPPNASSSSFSPAPSTVIHRLSVSPSSSPSASRHASWQARLWTFLFPGEGAAGVEGAATHYGHHSLASAAERVSEAPQQAWGRSHGSRPARGWVAEGGESLVGSMEPWHYVQVPLNRVLFYLRLQQRLADLWHQALWYAPFYLALLLFVLLGPVQHTSQAALDIVAARRDNDAMPASVSSQTQQVLREAFRLDTEAESAVLASHSADDFLPGNSDTVPWAYSWYNSSVNAWTVPKDRSASVDVQVRRVARKHHQPTFVTLMAVRTRRDVLRWLQLQLLPRLWDCRNPLIARPWRSTVTGSRYRLGALRLVSRRYQQYDSAESAAIRRNTSDPVMYDYVDGSWEATERQTSQLDREHAAVATPLLTSAHATPPDIPASLCVAEGAMEIAFDAAVGGYVLLLPFASACSSVGAILDALSTAKQRVLWPPAYNTSLVMREAWMAYAESNRLVGQNISDSSSSCASFIFDPAVSEVSLQYVEYGPATNMYVVNDITFSMPTGGAAVRPRLRIYTVGGLRWSACFTAVAFSVSLALMVLLYGHFLGRRMVTQFMAKVVLVARPRRTWVQQLWCAIHVLLHAQNFVQLIALVFSAAAVTYWWHVLVQLTRAAGVQYGESEAYPEQIDAIARAGGIILPRLCTCATFFATMGLIRFASLSPGLWLCAQTLVRSLQRMCVIFYVWITINIGVAMMAVLLYGNVASEFGSFGAAFTTLTFMLLDGGRALVNGHTLSKQTRRSVFFSDDSSLPGIRGSRLGSLEATPLDVHAMPTSSVNRTIIPAFLLFFFYCQGLVLIVWGTLTVVEAYRNVLLLPEAASLPLWRGLWPVQLTSLTHAASAEYAKEALRRLLLARKEAVMLTEMEYHLRLAYARAPTVAAAATVPGKRSSSSGGSAGAPPAHDETAVSLTMMLWLLPRALQLEYGAAHLRRLWYVCVAATLESQRREQPWKTEQWRRHWEQQPSSLTGWLRTSLPENDTIEEQAARVAMRLDELPNSVVRYVEGKFM